MTSLPFLLSTLALGRDFPAPPEPMAGHALMAATKAHAHRRGVGSVYVEADDPCGMPGAGTNDYAEAGSPMAAAPLTRRALYDAPNAAAMAPAWNSRESRRLEVDDGPHGLLVRLHGNDLGCQNEVTALDPSLLIVPAGTYTGPKGFEQMIHTVLPNARGATVLCATTTCGPCRRVARPS